MVDYSAEAVTARLLEVARALARRGFAIKGTDMSSAAIQSRLKILAALSDMSWRLVQVGQGLRPGGGEARDSPV